MVLRFCLFLSIFAGLFACRKADIPRPKREYYFSAMFYPNQKLFEYSGQFGGKAWFEAESLDSFILHMMIDSSKMPMFTQSSLVGIEQKLPIRLKNVKNKKSSETLIQIAIGNSPSKEESENKESLKDIAYTTIGLGRISSNLKQASIACYYGQPDSYEIKQTVSILERKLTCTHDASEIEIDKYEILPTSSGMKKVADLTINRINPSMMVSATSYSLTKVFLSNTNGKVVGELLLSTEPLSLTDCAPSAEAVAIEKLIDSRDNKISFQTLVDHASENHSFYAFDWNLIPYENDQKSNNARIKNNAHVKEFYDPSKNTYYINHISKDCINKINNPLFVQQSREEAERILPIMQLAASKKDVKDNWESYRIPEIIQTYQSFVSSHSSYRSVSTNLSCSAMDVVQAKQVQHSVSKVDKLTTQEAVNQLQTDMDSLENDVNKCLDKVRSDYSNQTDIIDRYYSSRSQDVCAKIRSRLRDLSSSARSNGYNPSSFESWASGQVSRCQNSLSQGVSTVSQAQDYVSEYKEYDQELSKFRQTSSICKTTRREVTRIETKTETRPVTKYRTKSKTCTRTSQPTYTSNGNGSATKRTVTETYDCSEQIPYQDKETVTTSKEVFDHWEYDKTCDSSL